MKRAFKDLFMYIAIAITAKIERIIKKSVWSLKIPKAAPVEPFADHVVHTPTDPQALELRQYDQPMAHLDVFDMRMR